MKNILFFLGIIACVVGFATSTPLEAQGEQHLTDQEIVQQRSPRSLFINSNGTVSDHIVTLLKADNLYEEGDDLIRVKNKTQAAWIAVCQGKGNVERRDLKDDEKRISIRPEVEEAATAMGLFAERAPALQQYSYGGWHGAFLDGCRRNLYQLVSLWKKGIKFESLIVLTGERPLRKEAGGPDALEKLCDEKCSPLPFKKGWKLPEGAPYEMEYDMMRLIWDQVELPEDMAKELEGKVVFINAPKGKNARPSTKDTLHTWIETCHPKPGTLIACSAPLLWAGQQLSGETALSGSGIALDTVASGRSEKEKAYHQDKIVSLIFDTVAKCLYELSLRAEKPPVK